MTMVNGHLVRCTFFVVCVMGLLTLSGLQTHTMAKEADTLSETDTKSWLLPFLSEFVFRTGDDNIARLVRWERPVSIRSFATPGPKNELALDVESLVERLRRRSGIDIGLFHGVHPSQLGDAVWMYKRDKLTDAPWLSDAEKQEDVFLDETLCAITIHSFEQYTITAAGITFIETQDRAATAGCVINAVFNVVVSGLSATVVGGFGLPIHEPIALTNLVGDIIRVLYDDRLSVGMPKTEAMPIIETIVDELIAARRARGSADEE